MIIQTNFGKFGSFQDVRRFMLYEDMDTIFISDVDYWGIHISCKGVYSMEQIDFILSDPDNEQRQMDKFSVTVSSGSCFGSFDSQESLFDPAPFGIDPRISFCSCAVRN